MLELTVLDYDRIGGSDPIGKVVLGYKRKKLEKKHWVEMVENPRRPIIHWHVLQVSYIYIFLFRTIFTCCKLTLNIFLETFLIFHNKKFISNVKIP